MNINKVYILALLCSGIIGCSKSEKAGNEESTVSLPVDSEAVAEVDTVFLIPSDFSHDIVSNGVIKANDVADLYFRTSEIIDKIYVRNGQQVSAGQPIASLSTAKLLNEKQRIEATLAQNKLDLLDFLIGQGYDPERTKDIPADVMELATVRSGLKQTEAQLRSNAADIEACTLRAPFAGKVANIEKRVYDLAPSAEPFCRIISNGGMYVDFPVLESEYGLVGIGTDVDVKPFSMDKAMTGKITELNPVVDENGQISVKAVVNASGINVADGMKASVRARKQLGERLVVPKEAVVLRTGRQVVFTYENGKAMWNYVTTGLENLDSYEITDGLKPGMTVIVKGNENLAHEAPVKIAK